MVGLVSTTEGCPGPPCLNPALKCAWVAIAKQADCRVEHNAT